MKAKLHKMVLAIALAWLACGCASISMTDEEYEAWRKHPPGSNGPLGTVGLPPFFSGQIK